MKIKLNSAIFYLLLLFVTTACAVEPLPSNLINFTSNAGQKYLRENADSNTVKLLSHFTTQKTTTYCGVASVVMVLNSSNLTKPADTEHAPYHYFNQDDFFTDPVKAIIAPEEVLKTGISLDQLNQIVETFGLTATRYYADQFSADRHQTSLEKFRKTLTTALAHQNFVIVNFLRTGLNQVGGGHHSPLAAYDAKQDRFLLLDVARYKYPAYWVKTEDLWNAVNTKDGNLSRGVIVIKNIRPITP